MKRLGYFLLIVLIVGMETARAQYQSSGFQSDVSKVGTVAVPFLTIGIGARANAMGGAFASVANDVTALFWNPAGLTSFDKNEIGLIHTDWIADLKHDYIGLAVPLGNAGILGFSFNALTMDELMVRTPVFPEGTGEMAESYDMAIGVSYARKITDLLSLGASVKYIQSVLWHMSAQTMAVDLGVVFSDLFNFIQLGASISNMGGKIKYSGRDNFVYHDIRPSENGNNARIDAELQTGEYNLPVTFRMGLSTTINKDSSLPLLLAVDLTEPSDNYRCVNIGGEWSLYNTVFLRGGYAGLFEPDSERGITAGAGLLFNIPFSDIPVSLDYCYQDFGVLNNTQTYSLRLMF